MERDVSRPEYCFFSQISTHTLTWSVTAYSFYRSAAWKISTHTLTWSVTECAPATDKQKAISTHTLTWSVTKMI